MPRLISLAVVLLVALPAFAQKAETGKVESAPPLPAPKWVKYIDQGTKDPRLKGYVTPEGIKVEIVAEAPVVVNPVGMAFDDDGSLFYLESAAGLDKKAWYFVKVLRLNKEKGIYDRAEVVLDGDRLSSVWFHNGWLYATGRRSVVRYRQSKETGPYDVKETIADGFDAQAAFAVGNDGWVYIAPVEGPNKIRGSDGSRVTVPHTGAIFRCRPDGSRVQIFAVGFCGPDPSIAFDAGFNLFHINWDHDNRKPEGLRLVHATEGSDFGWRWPYDNDGINSTCVETFRAMPGVIGPFLKSQAGSPAGLLIYNDTFFPVHYRGLLIYADTQRKRVRACRVEPRGASFKAVEEVDLLRSDDSLFRPGECVAGPDGAIYIIDRRAEFVDKRVRNFDRIYRLTWDGTKDDPAIPPRGLDSWAKIRKLDNEELLKTLESENFSDRLKAQQEFVRRGEKHRPALLKVLPEIERPVHARIAALGALNSLWNDDVAKAFVARVQDIEPDIRRLAVEGLGMHGSAKGDDVVAVLEDGDPAVRRAAALGLGRTNAPGVAEILVDAMVAYEGKDAVLLDGLVRAIELTGKDGTDRLIALTESGDMKKFNRAVETFPMLRTRAGADALPHLLKNPHLTIPQRVSLIRSYNHYLLDPPVSVEPVLEYLVKTPDEAVAVKMAGLGVVAQNHGLKGLAARNWLIGLLEDRDVALHKAALPLIGVDPDGAKKVGKLFLDGKIAKELRPLVMEALKRHAGKDADAAKLLTMIEM